MSVAELSLLMTLYADSDREIPMGLETRPCKKKKKIQYGLSRNVVWKGHFFR